MKTFDEIIQTNEDNSRILRVVDTAYIALAWLDQHCPGVYTAGDVLTLTRMILEQEKQAFFGHSKAT